MNKSIYGFVISTLLFCHTALAECTNLETKNGFQKRFEVNDAQVFDAKTNLTWQRCSVGTRWSLDDSCTGELEYMSLRAAKEMVAARSDEWRLPNIEELFSLLEVDCTGPSINAEVFPDIVETGEGSPYWSTSEVSDLPILFYFIDFWNGSADGHTEGFPLAVRLVKSN